MIEEALRDRVTDDGELIWLFVVPFEHGEFFDVLLFHLREEGFAVIMQNSDVGELPLHGFEIIFSMDASRSLKYAATAFRDFSYRDHQFSCAVCFDLRFPELFREYLKMGTHCVIVQAAWPAVRVADFELLLRARALENRGYVIGCNCIGYDSVGGVDYPGRSLVCDFEGRVIEDAGVFEVGVGLTLQLLSHRC